MFKVPKNQRLWVTRYDSKGNPKWVITSDMIRAKYYLYSCEGDSMTKVKVADSPAAFEEEIGSPI